MAGECESWGAFRSTGGNLAGNSLLRLPGELGCCLGVEVLRQLAIGISTRRQSRTAAFLGAVGVPLTVLLVGCGGGDGGEQPAWQQVDPCALADSDQVAKLDESASKDSAIPPVRSDHGGPGCHWDRYLQINIVGDVATQANSSSGTYSTEEYSGNRPARTFDLEGRHVTVTAERGGRCSVFTRYSQAQLTVSIEVARSKTNIDTADTSPVSCDAQKPLIGSILSRVELR